LNAILGVLLFRPDASSPSKPATSKADTESLTTHQLDDVRESGPDDLRGDTAALEFSWAQLASRDHRVFIANLRAIGCPEEIIRDIIVADVNRLYREKFAQAPGTSKKYEYWKSEVFPGNPFGDQERMQKMAALEGEKRQMLTDLGFDITQSAMPGGVDPMAAMLDFLPESKRASVKKAMADSQSRVAEFADELRIDPAGTFLKMQRETEEAVQAVLTPEEFLDYQLRFSQTAQNLRQKLSGFDPSEEEFLAIYKLRSEFDREYLPAMMKPNEATMAEYPKAEARVNEQIRATLGEERYAEYERAGDQSFQQLQAIVQQAGLERTAANEVYELKRAVDAQVAEVRGNQSLTAEERRTALESIGQDAERSAQQILGEDVWKRYDLSNTMWWLRGLTNQSGSVSIQSSTRN
jgi:hypothetical protein